ncbi:MAG: DUF3990 domain-containing protein [Eubacteriales bacterium]|nr:DUF3990 domain-containing protein [Eubacteriales bacterium]
MGMTEVFHGTDHILKKPVYLGGKSDNDYGNGFYVTEYEDRARSWAALNGNPDKAIVNVYELNMEPLRILDLNDYGVLSWIAEVVKNRGTEQENAQFVGDKLVELYCQDTSDVDIIKGYRADDSYTQVIEAFLLNQINITEVERLFYKGELGNQIFLKSPRAFENIRWKEAYHVSLEQSDMESDFYARKEVNRFLSGRMKAILLEGYEVPGITARYAVQNHLIYHREGSYYE